LEFKMKVRKPPLDFSEVPVHWSHNREFAQRWNAGSFVPAYIEPFLVKVLTEAKPLLAGKPALLDEVGIFIKQEMEHCKQHMHHDEDGRVKYHFVLVDYLCLPVGGALHAGDDVSHAEWAHFDLDAAE
jgi:predicted metal-dependent hydrolase